MRAKLRFPAVIVLFLLQACAPSVSTSPAPNPLPATAGSTPLSPMGAASPGGPADIIFTNGIVLTMDTANPTAEALAIQGDRILAVGTQNELLKLRGPTTTVVDLGGRTLMPGFVDAHAHLILAAQGSTDKFSQIQAEALQGGITTETEMGVTADLFNQLESYDAAGLMKIRWNVYFAYDTNCGDPLDHSWFKIYKQGQDVSGHVRTQGVKIWADGGSCHVPAVTFEYPGGYGQGDLYMTQDQLTGIVREVQSEGYQIGIHALGDRAIEQAQNAIAAALNGAPNTFRHRIEHNAVLHDALLPRYNQVGILPIIFGSYPTCWRVRSTAQFKYAVPVNLGTWEWPWRALLEANPGIKAAWHSDYPVFPNIQPMAHLYGFVTRNQVADDGSICQAPDWLKQGAITADEALHIMTIHSAYALFREDEVGSLTPGKLADVIVLSDDPERVQPEAIKDIRVLMTMIGGTMEYCASESESLCPPAAAANAATSEGGNAPAGGITAAASQSLPDHPPSNALDGSIDTWWSAGSGPEQWIQVDLGKPTPVSQVRLVVSQYPEGETDHQLWAGPDAGHLTLIHEFKGDTQDLEVLDYSPPSSLTNTRFIRIVTIQSPSWVAWREIQVTGK